MAPNKEVTQKALVTEPEAKAPPSVQPGGFKFGQGSLLKPSQTTASGKTVADTSSLLTTAVKVQQEDVANKGDSSKKVMSSPGVLESLKGKEAQPKLMKEKPVEAPPDAPAAKTETKATAEQPGEKDQPTPKEVVQREKLLKRKREIEDKTDDAPRAPAPSSSSYQPKVEESAAVEETPAMESDENAEPPVLEGEAEPKEEEAGIEESNKEPSASAPGEAKPAEAYPSEATPDTEESKEAVDAAKPEPPMVSAFGSSLSGTSGTFGSGTTFGATVFDKSAPPISFGRCTNLATASTQAPAALGSTETSSIPPPTTFGSAASSSAKPPAFGGGAFLNMKPPGTTAPTFTFGSSGTITLPTPAKGLPASGVQFGSFGYGGSSPFSGSAVQAHQPLFGASSSTKWQTPDDDEGDEGDESATK